MVNMPQLPSNFTKIVVWLHLARPIADIALANNPAGIDTPVMTVLKLEPATEES
jgi:hypothetical protein